MFPAAVIKIHPDSVGQLWGQEVYPILESLINLARQWALSRLSVNDWWSSVNSRKVFSFITIISSVQFSRSVVSNSATPWISARQASLSITNSRSLLRLTSIESVMPSSHFILCRPLLLLPPIPPSISLFQWVNSSHEVAKVLEFQL